MDRRSLGLAPTYPRPTMRALLITACLFATVPSAEALASLPSISSSAGIAMAVVFSVAAALSLVVGVSFFKWVKRLVKRKKKPAQENVEAGQPQISPPQQSESDEVHSPPTQEEIEKEFYEFLQQWNAHNIHEKDAFLNGLFKEFPVAVTPEMAMAALQKMLSDELDAELWMRMLRFIMMLERDLFHWDHTRPHRDGENTPTSRTHDEFQSFLVTQAEDILREHGDVAQRNETAEAGFMRFVAYLFGFVCKYKRILELMDCMWSEHGLRQTDASRAMVWGYRRWKDDRRWKGQPTAIEPSGNHRFFHALMQTLNKVGPGRPRKVGTTAQHLLFALGCGYEPDPEQGPLAYMSDNKSAICPMDYLWLMMGRDLVMGNAWHWMCKKGLSEHDRMCNLFGQKSVLYPVIVDMVMKYDQEYDEENEECMETFAIRYSSAIQYKIDFDEHRNWYERYKREKKAIGLGINAWLEKNAEKWEGKTMEAGTGTSTIRVAGVAVSSNSNSKSSKSESSSKLPCISE